MFREKISLIYWTAKLLNKPMTYGLATNIANRFSFKEIVKIYRRVRYDH